MKRRTLKFTSLDDAVTDAKRLLTGGYVQAGNWALGRALEHLTILMNASVDGFPASCRAPWFVRLLGPTIVKPLLLKVGKMPKGMIGPADLMPKGGADDAAELSRFAAAVARVQAATSFQPSPYLGAMTPAQWRRLHGIHAAHHLGFLVPRV